MYKLNVLARSLSKHVSYEDRHPIVDQIYSLKDELIKYLYQSGYATEVRESFQDRPCRACGGSGEYWTGAECYRCYGTGVYAVTKLYAFRFCVDGKPYAWHQLQKLVDYPVTLTDVDPAPFRTPKVEEEFLKMEDAWLGVCVVWWALFLHGTPIELMLFRHWRLRMALKTKDIRRAGRCVWRWLTTWSWEKVGQALVVVCLAAMILFFIFYAPVLRWIWCNIFQRCLNGVPY